MAATPPTPDFADSERRRVARLRALSILDTEPDPAFDALVRTAAAVCGTPIALVSLVDADRQWFKANHGLDGVPQTPREVAFCDHTIRSGGVLVVPDAEQDKRFAANPLVTGAPGIRFYAGAPIEMPGGERVGSLCVIGLAPGALTPAQRAALADLALVTQRLLLQRERLHDLSVVGDETRFQAISQAAPLGVFQADEAGAVFYASPRWRTLFGLAEEQAWGDGWLAAVAPAARAAVRSAWQAAVRAVQPFRMEFAVPRADGSTAWLEMQARPSRWGEPPRSGFVGVVGDITARKAAEQALQQANRFRERAERLGGVGGWEAELATRTVRWTGQVHRIYGLPPDHVPGWDDWRRHYPAHALARIDAATARAVQHGEPWDLELPMQRASGETVWVRTVGEAEFEDGRAVRLVGALQDVTAEKSTREDLQTAYDLLQHSEERQTRALQASGLVLWDLDLRSGRLYLSENWGDIIGGPQRPTVTTSQALAERVPPAQQPALAQALRALLKGETDRYEMEHQVRREDGSWVWIRSEGRVTERGADGRALQVSGTNKDIDARKRAEDALARTAAMLRATLDASANGVMVVGLDREVLLHNAAFLTLWGIPPEVAAAGGAAMTAHARARLVDPEGFAARVDALYAEPATHSHDVLRLTDGRVLERHGRPMLVDGRAIGRVWTFSDISASQEAQARARTAREAAEAANRAKSEFLDNVSHEMRTPLNGVLGMTRLLEATPLDGPQRHYLRLIDASASAMLELVDDLLDVSKIEAGELELERIPFSLPRVAAELAELYRLRAAEKGLGFTLDVARDVPEGLLGDPGRLRQILNNLLSNALKFTSTGHIGLTVSRSVRGGVATYHLAVSDTGIGIAPEVQQRLFTRFSQADSSTTRRFGGTGLGLAIVRQLCEMMGGRITLQSASGAGSLFRCDIPFEAVDAATVPAPLELSPPPVRGGLRVLVAEDNPTNQVVVRGLLAQAGCTHVTLVDDGAQAVREALRGDYTLVLMDCRMPVLDGYGAARQLRAQGFDRPIIALTANAGPAERERCLAHGMDDHLAKPIDRTLLGHALARWSGAPAAAAPATPPATPAAMPPAAPAAAPAAAPVAGPLFDAGHALALMDGDTELLDVSLGAFRDHMPQLVSALAQAVAQADREATHRHLHSLAGSSALVGALPLEQLARHLEACAAGGDLAAVRGRLAALQDCAARTLAEMGH